MAAPHLNALSNKHTASTSHYQLTILMVLSGNGISVSARHQPQRPPFTMYIPAAYFSQQRLDSLGTIEDVSGVGDLEVPDGLFKSARVSNSCCDYRDSSYKTHGLLRSIVYRSPMSSVPVPRVPRLAQMYSGSKNESDRCRYMDSKPTQSHSSASLPAGVDSTSSTQSSVPLATSRQLVPLQFLQNISYTRRDPMDEQVLQRFSMYSPLSGPPMCTC